MSLRSLFPLVAGAAACALAGAAPAAPLESMPSSPAFKMGVNKGETGAPEPTLIGARPIEVKVPAGAGGEKAAEKGLGKGAGKGLEKSAEKSAEKADGPEAKSGDRKAADAKPGDKAGEAPASADPMDLLRQKLADKLGATPTADGKFGMRVSNRGESGENVVTAVRPGAAAASGGHRAPAHRAPAAPGGAGNALLPTRWDYGGAAGPQSWGKLQSEFSTCANGSRQSPIDIHGGIAVDLEPIRFDYRPSAFSVVDNGHTVQVNVEPGNAITITGRRYELVQFHFHRPSEERIEGRQYDMVAHLVHKDVDGRLAVVAVLLDRGSAQAIVQTVWNNLPLEKGDEVKGGSRIDLSELLPEDRRYYTYMGSLTTPPCSEGVLWMVMKQPVPISPEQVAIFAHLYPMNARPLQQAGGRLIKESN
ncbi:MAG: carbonic anhydrase family protein [Burkholderiaceae bacterium]